MFLNVNKDDEIITKIILNVNKHDEMITKSFLNKIQESQVSAVYKEHDFRFQQQNVFLFYYTVFTITKYRQIFSYVHFIIV